MSDRPTSIHQCVWEFKNKVKEMPRIDNKNYTKEEEQMALGLVSKFMEDVDYVKNTYGFQCLTEQVHYCSIKRYIDDFVESIIKANDEDKDQ